MIQFQQYFGRVNGLRGTFVGLPSWARTILGIFAIPGLAIMALSIVLFVVSILALFLLVLPVYSLLLRLTGSSAGGSFGGMTINSPFGPAFASGTKHVDATVVEPK
ncbi:MAG: hypothetical protein JO353_07360 [Phycisphaerae bacterium]|nr:hypothetical protein [Phycisphaerae bacterium]